MPRNFNENVYVHEIGFRKHSANYSSSSHFAFLLVSPFWVMKPKIRPVGDTALSSQLPWAIFMVVQFHQPPSFCNPRLWTGVSRMFLRRRKRGGGISQIFLVMARELRESRGREGGKQGLNLGVTKRCRLFGLTNSVLVNSDRFIDREKETECGRYRLALELNIFAYGDQINLDDLTRWVLELHFSGRGRDGGVDNNMWRKWCGLDGGSRARICRPFMEPRNLFLAWRNRFLGSINVSKYGLWIEVTEDWGVDA